MAKGAYIGVNGIARKIKGGYIGVDGVARKIKKAYVGVGGIARLCWATGPELVYYGTATALSTGRYRLAATTIGNYGLFGGGTNGNDYTNALSTVDAYDQYLVRTNPTSFSAARSWLAATTVGNYALFGGGCAKRSSNSSTAGSSSVVNAYSESLTRTTVTSLSHTREHFSATTVGDYALFAGGGIATSTTLAYDTVNAYDTSLTRTSPTALSIARFDQPSTAVGDYALIGGGSNYSDSSGYTAVDAYDKSLTRTAATSLSYYANLTDATTVGDYALFAINQTYVDAYDTSLTKFTIVGLSVNGWSVATTIDNYALICCGNSSNPIVDVYDQSLTKTTSVYMSVPRYGLASTTVGNYALFGGGYCYSSEESSYRNIVDVFTVV